ncbi:hypothetical protein DEV91_12655 [Phyllobacterium brassicacearum]|nr:hypothetical protein DEV91_12655 [Phyllobacterium brassicacearum]
MERWPQTTWFYGTQSTGKKIRHVAGPCNDPFDRLQRCRFHQIGRVDRTRHGDGRDARKLGDVRSVTGLDCSDWLLIFRLAMAASGHSRLAMPSFGSVAVKDGRTTFRLRGQAFDEVFRAIKRGILRAEFRERFGITGIDGQMR